ncbi:MAG: hypothetical protein LBG18_04630 [Mediterranea sp.]|jgi:hypothetical protein|nr:hypothetical protein [Mediterranea sp.]
MKSYKELYFIPVLLFCLSSCQYWEDEKFVATVPRECNYNIIGISGPPSAEPYVEIQYNKDDGHGNNVLVSKRVSPPFRFGGQKVNILCDSILFISGIGSHHKYRIDGYKLVIHHSYEETDGEYLRIFNHSTDKTLEYFIAGSREMETEFTGCSGFPLIKTMPAVYYKHAPIYYLLFPDKKYTQNVQGDVSDCNDIFYFEGNRCGDLTVEQPWSVDSVMKLYRSEYRNSPDIRLDVESYWSHLGRMTKVVHSGDSYDIPFQSFYGTILPGEELKGNISLPLLATPSIFDDRLDYR